MQDCPMKLGDVAPRLARARDGELRYQARVAAQRRAGELTLDVAMEQLIRSVRAGSKSMSKLGASLSKLVEKCEPEP